MTEVCTVKKVKRGVAHIVIERKDECNGCKICSFNNKNSMTVPALCDIPVTVGEKVVVEMPTRAVGAGSLSIYAVPVLLMLIGALIGLVGSVWLQIGLCAAGLALGFVAAFLIDRAYRKKSGVMPRVVRSATGDTDGSASSDNAINSENAENTADAESAETEEV